MTIPAEHLRTHRMRRRAFVAAALGGLPLAGIGQDAKPDLPGPAVVVRAGRSLADEVLRFFRKFTKDGVMPSREELPALFMEHGMKIVGPPLQAPFNLSDPILT